MRRIVWPSVTLVTANNKLYAIGGWNGQALGTVEEYNPGTNTWTARTSMSATRYFLAAATGGCLMLATRPVAGIWIPLAWWRLPRKYRRRALAVTDGVVPRTDQAHPDDIRSRHALYRSELAGDLCDRLKGVVGAALVCGLPHA